MATKVRISLEFNETEKGALELHTLKQQLFSQARDENSELKKVVIAFEPEVEEVSQTGSWDHKRKSCLNCDGSLQCRVGVLGSPYWGCWPCGKDYLGEELIDLQE